ncbi:MAG: hypothetical protein JOZ21_00170 [Verrucomicrobia bacterium]|nr:hypothetical protein [Verrucomicrobiota bacterium]
MALATKNFLGRQMAMIGCTTEVIAQHFHCSRDTIERRFRYELDEGRSHGRRGFPGLQSNKRNLVSFAQFIPGACLGRSK